jgi:hypothetical protein
VGERTIDGNGNALVEDVAISTDEGRDLAELVVLEVLRAGGGGVGVDNLEIEAIGLGHGEDGRRPGVGLRKSKSVSGCTKILSPSYRQQAHLVCVELSERHNDGITVCAGEVIEKENLQVKFRHKAFLRQRGNFRKVGPVRGV